MKNNKGFTTVEVLVCFILVSVVMMSMFSVISAFNKKRYYEGYRSQVYEYKNILTKQIQDDFIKIGLVSAQISRIGKVSTGEKYTIDCTLRDGTYRQLVVFRRFTKTAVHQDGNPNLGDEFYIEYGTVGNLIRLDFPNLGSVKGYYSEDNHAFLDCYSNHNLPDANLCSNSKDGGVESLDFQINNVQMYITNEANPDLGGHVLVIYIGFYHPDLGTKYAINIAAPINYQNE